MHDNKPLPQRPTRQHESLQVQAAHQNVDSFAHRPQDVFSCDRQRKAIYFVQNEDNLLSEGLCSLGRESGFQPLHHPLWLETQTLRMSSRHTLCPANVFSIQPQPERRRQSGIVKCIRNGCCAPASLLKSTVLSTELPAQHLYHHG